MLLGTFKTRTHWGKKTPNHIHSMFQPLWKGCHQSHVQSRRCPRQLMLVLTHSPLMSLELSVMLMMQTDTEFENSTENTYNGHITITCTISVIYKHKKWIHVQEAVVLRFILFAKKKRMFASHAIRSHAFLQPFTNPLCAAHMCKGFSFHLKYSLRHEFNVVIVLVCNFICTEWKN